MSLKKPCLRKKKDKSLGNLVKKIKRLNQMAKYSLENELRPVVDSLIEQKSQSVQEIEHTLDSLLDMGQLGYGEKEFKRLNDYYGTFQEEHAKHYSQYWKEMNDD